MSLLKDIQKLRDLTKAGVMDCRQALEKTNGDMLKAKAWLEQKSLKTAAKKKDRQTSVGLVEAYVHNQGRIGAMVRLSCETDFVARNKVFKKLALELAMQVAAMNPANIKELMTQEYIRDPKQKIAELVKQAIGKLKENIKIEEIVRMES